MTQNHTMITRDAVVEVSRSSDFLGFFNMHLNLSTQVGLHQTFTSIENAASVAKVFKKHPCFAPNLNDF